MNKLGIWATVTIGAFIFGLLSANPVVEAVEGWQGAIVELQEQIDNIPPGPTVVTVQDTDNPVCAADELEAFEWCPPSEADSYRINDPSVTLDSVVVANITPFGRVDNIIISPGSFLMDGFANDGTQLNYVVFNP